MKTLLLFLVFTLGVQQISWAYHCRRLFKEKLVEKEIERKFLLYKDSKHFVSDRFLDIFGSFAEIKARVEESGVLIQQGYITVPQAIVELTLGRSLPFEPKEMRVRSKNNEIFYFTAKGEGALARDEFEMQISKSRFALLWGFTEGHRISKKRLDIEVLDQTITFDLYKDRDLMVAEVEFKSLTQANAFKSLGRDITEDSQYKNANLAKVGNK